ncbi:MAG: carbohydrate kinase family protein [Cytophagales bacterium]|nr:carbohydrate kinase family protein [Cytophagales bacterium]
MASIICGSLAFDNIMRFEGRFADAILPDQLHKLSVSFYVPHLKREFGGCAGNIAYGLKLLGGVPLPMATLGSDGADYLQRFQTLGIDTQLIRTVPDSVTALAMIMTDNDNNQITAFHPGAMAEAHRSVITANNQAQLGIISPDGRQAMLEHAEQFKTTGIPFVFDPGQGLPMFDGAELKHFIDLATWVTVNDYEAQMLTERTGWTHAAIASRVKGYAITLGEKGAEIWEGGSTALVPPVTASRVVDPTGCGDAWRSALLFGLEQGWSMARCAELGNQVAAIKIASAGGQNYQLT